MKQQKEAGAGLYNWTMVMMNGQLATGIVEQVFGKLKARAQVLLVTRSILICACIYFYNLIVVCSHIVFQYVLVHTMVAIFFEVENLFFPM